MHPAPAALAETLLREWEARTRPAPTPAYQAARRPVLALLTEFCESLRADDPITVDAEDVRAVLHQSTAIGLGSAVAYGPDRASQAAASVIAAVRAQQLGPTPTAHPVLALLAIRSGPDLELQMDELTEITETVQTAFGQDLEMIFGHNDSAGLLGPALHVWLLVGYAAPVNSP